MLVLTGASVDDTAHAQVVLADFFGVPPGSRDSTVPGQCLDSFTTFGNGYFG